VSRWWPLATALVAVAAVAVAVVLAARGHDAERPDGAIEAPAALIDLRPLPTSPGRVVGYVRDVNGHAVPHARVRLATSHGEVRASGAGRFAVRAPSGRVTLIADRAGYTRQSVTTTLPAGRGARVDFALAITAPKRVAVANSADRLLVWTSCDQLVRLSAADLHTWMARGADGFVCETGSLSGLGGSQSFTGSAAGLPRDAGHRLQRELEASPAVREARAGKLLLYLAFYVTNYFNARTPLTDWFDDGGWSRSVLPRVRDLAAAARSMDFAGLALDQELYPQKGGVRSASWSVRYPGNTRTEAEVRAQARVRGRQVMQAMLQGYPGLELVAYDTRLPGAWQAKVDADINHQRNAYADSAQIDFWDGLSSVEGYSAIRWIDAVFYKTFHLPGASWDTALQYNANSVYSYLSRRFSNWTYASSRLHLSPFSWVDSGPAAFDRARDPRYVAEQLEAFRRWGSGGAFANYAYRDLRDFDYGPYVDAMRHASSPARVDTTPPKLALVAPTPDTRRLTAAQTVSLDGVASDDFAVQAVRWNDDRGRQGAVPMTWRFSGDQRSGWQGEMAWSLRNFTVPRDAGHVTITAQDIHGLASQLRLTVAR
jgi:hypothetical protein